MKKIYPLSALLLLAGCLTWTACSEDESLDLETHDPSSFFEPADSDESPEAVLRRTFQQKHNSFLLFNDTLQHRFNGLDINGDSTFWTELLALDYVVGQTAYPSNGYTYNNMTSVEDKANAVTYLEENILPHISARLMPYSWYLCGQINYRQSSTAAPSHPYAATGQRCIVVAFSQLKKLKTDAQRKQFTSRILTAILPQLASNRIEAFDAFYQVSEGYHDRTTTDNVTEARHVVRYYGFLDYVKNIWGHCATPTKEQDLTMYCTYSMTYTDEQIEQMYADYPNVLKKWRIFKQVMTEIGFVF